MARAPTMEKAADPMTKAMARQRAKAKAAQKVKKRVENAEHTHQEIRPGQFDPGASSMKSFSANTSAKSFGAARRGASRSR